jgi:single-strand DNA-binding protein
MALNHIDIMGRICNEIELRRTSAGKAVTSFTLAVDRDYNPGGNKETDFIECVAWDKTAEFVSKYFGKGRVAIVSGRLQIRGWTDKNGNKRRNAEVVADNIYFGDAKFKSETEPSEPASYGNAPAGDFSMLDDDDGEIPF